MNDNNPFGFDIADLLSEKTFQELEATADFKTRMAELNNTLQKNVADLLMDGEKLKVSDRVLWLMACGNISALMSSTLLNLMDHHHEDGKDSPSFLAVAAAMAVVCSTMVRRNFTAMMRSLKSEDATPHQMGLRRVIEGEAVSVDALRKVLTKGGMPVADGAGSGQEFVYLNQLGSALFGEMIERSPIQTTLTKMPQSTNIDFERQAHGLKIVMDEEEMARSLANTFQEITRSVAGVYMANSKADEALGITHHGASMLVAYCATLSVNSIRRNEENGRSMTRMDAARLFVQRVSERALESAQETLAEVEKQEAGEKLRFQEPAGQA